MDPAASFPLRGRVKSSSKFVKTSLLLLFYFFLLNIAYAQIYTGYTLYYPQNGTKAYLIDGSGTTYHSWTFTSSATSCYSSYLLPGQVLLRTVNHAGNYFSGGPVSGEVQKVNWSGTVVWDYVYSTSDYCSHHDIHPMPNGNVLLIAYERKTAAQVVQAGGSQNIEMWPEKIVEIQPSGTNGGTVVWEWHVWDHLVQHYNSAKDNYGVIADHPELININYKITTDWMHANGIDYNPTLDQITFSSHNLNEVYVIDHSTTTAQAATHTGGNSGKGGDILYRWGNPLAYETSGTVDFNVVHDAHWVPSYAPQYANALVGFNNKGGTGSKSCVDIFVPPINGYNYTKVAGQAYAPTTYDWRHTYSGSATQDMGSSQQLPNGNTFICISQSGYVYEINSSQTVVYSKSIGGTLPQSHKYPPCYVTGTYTATPSATPNVVCAGTSVQLNTTVTGDVAYTYSWTSNPAGFTSAIQNPVVTPTVTTVYTVTVTNGPCSATGSVTVTVNNPPQVTASATPPAICLGSSSQLYAAVSGGISYTYSWTSVPAGFTSTIQNPVVSPTVNTTYTVVVTSNGCSASSSTTVTVNPNPTVTASANPTLICAGESSQLTATPAGGSNYTFSWTSVPAGFTSTLQNPVVYPTVSTLYFVTVTSNGCTGSSSAGIGVNPGKTLNLHLFLEGLYAGGGIMTEARDNTGPHFGSGVADQVTVELHSAADYSVIAYSYGLNNLSTSGNVIISNIPCTFSGNYYVTVKHRNSIATTTASPVSFAGTTINYDFSAAASSAYGSNLRNWGGTGIYVIYTGDTNQDGIIDLGDLIGIDNDAANAVSGYVTTDINGNGVVNLTDMEMTIQNSGQFVSFAHP